MDIDEGKRRLTEVFGSREQMLGSMLITLSRTGQPCDVTFYKKKPILNVKVPQSINLALMYDAGAKKLKQMLDRIQFSDGGTRARARGDGHRVDRPDFAEGSRNCALVRFQ